ncbi:MAG: hypothetical protein H0Z24_03515 [Thermosipho sp. (in: Bacteria)]|nr:hypothetical protein [Thermosipho sp. (in: thermotogales)]
MSGKYIIWGLSVTASFGIGIVVTAVLYMLLEKIFKNRADKFRATEPQFMPKQTLFLKKLFDDRTILFSMGGGAILFGLVALGSLAMLPFMFMGAVIGFIVGHMLKRVTRNSMEFKKIKEVALLYECIDLFTKARYTVRQSLQISKILVPNLERHIDNCLSRWPSGPLNAIELLGEEIGVKHADMLSGILMQAEEAGVENVKGIMEQEAIRLEELRESLAESRIATKPIYSSIYLFLPVASILGIIVSPLAYRAIQLITSFQAGGLK